MSPPAKAVFRQMLTEQVSWLARELEKSAPSALIELIEMFSPDELTDLIHTLSAPYLFEVLSQLDTQSAAPLLTRLKPTQTAQLLRLDSKKGSDQLAELVKETLEAKLVDRIQQLSEFEEDSVGAIMDSAVFTCRAEESVDDVLSRLRESRFRHSRYIHIVDNAQKLTGIMSFKDAFYSPGNTIVSSLMNSKLATLKPDIPLELALKKKEWAYWSSLPVTNYDGVLLGALRYEDCLQPPKQIHTQGKQNASGSYSPAKEVVELFKQGLTAIPDTFGVVEK